MVYYINVRLEKLGIKKGFGLEALFVIYWSFIESCMLIYWCLELFHEAWKLGFYQILT